MNLPFKQIPYDTNQEKYYEQKKHNGSNRTSDYSNIASLCTIWIMNYQVWTGAERYSDSNVIRIKSLNFTEKLDF